MDQQTGIQCPVTTRSSFSRIPKHLSSVVVLGLLGLTVAVASAVYISLPGKIRVAPVSITVNSSSSLPPEVQALEAQSAPLLFDRDTTTAHVAFAAQTIDTTLDRQTEIRAIKVFGASPYELTVYAQQSGSWTSIPGLTKLKLSGLSAGWNELDPTQSYTTQAIRFELTPISSGNNGNGNTGNSNGGNKGNKGNKGNGNSTQTTTTTTSSSTSGGLAEIEIWGTGEHALLSGNALINAAPVPGQSTNTALPEQLRSYTATPDKVSVGKDGQSFTLNIDRPAARFKRAWLVYEAYGLSNWVSPVRRINGNAMQGGAFVFSGSDWTQLAEPIHPGWLKAGSNQIDFSLPANVAGNYSIRNVRVLAELDDGNNFISRVSVGQVSSKGDIESDIDALTDGDMSTSWSPYTDPRSKGGNPVLTAYFDKSTQLDSLSLNMANSLDGTISVDLLVDGQWQSAGLSTINGKKLNAGWNALSGFAQLAADAVRLTFLNGTGSSAEIRDLTATGSGAGLAYTPDIVVPYPDAGQFYGRQAYLRGFLSMPDNGSGAATLTAAGQSVSITDGSFGILISKDDAGYANQADGEPWQVELVATYPDGQKISKIVKLYQSNDAAKAHGTLPNTVNPGFAAIIAAGAASLDIGPDALDKAMEIKVTPLVEKDLPALDPGMTNVTPSPSRGYRFTPHGIHFKRDIKVTIPFDPALIPAGLNENDIKTFYFDTERGHWVELTRYKIDSGKHKVISLTNHFTDMINATLTVPDHPETASFNATQMKDIKAADPGAGINLIEPSKANNMGDARLSYPIEIPPGRQGIQPQFSIGYNSSGGNGWVGLGWDVSVPSISIETRWGVPRYDPQNESETYVLNGEMLTPVAHRGALQPRSSEKVFHTRIEGAFRKIIRHGDSPANYWWEVVDKNGVKNYYGGNPTAGKLADNVLDASGGNGTNPGVFQWFLYETQDAHNNFVRYHYKRVSDTGLAEGKEPGTNLYLDYVTYTGYGDVEGKYKIAFTRASQLGEKARADIQIDARGGFKRVTADLLRRIDVKYLDGTADGKLVRAYELKYNEDVYGNGVADTAYNKTLLSAIVQYGKDRQTEFNRHRFTYYDDIRDGTKYQAYESTPTSWTIPSDGLHGGFTTNISGFTDQASALSGQAGSGSNKHLAVTIGPNDGNIICKSNTVGGKQGWSSRSSRGMVSLIDIDGDGLPDKVIDTKNGLKYYPNLDTPDSGLTQFSTTSKTIGGQANKFSADSANSDDSGVEAVLGCSGITATVGNNAGNTTTTTQVYYADVNGDGLIDIVDNGAVFFNHREGNVENPATPKLTSGSAGTPNPIYSGAAASGLTISAQDAKAKRDALNEAHPLHDTVRVWEAPFDGTVAVTGGVKLNLDTSVARQDYGDKADGVTLRIEAPGGKLWSQRITGKDTEDVMYPDPAIVGSIPVTKGQRIYFREQSYDDGAFDQVSWSPQVEYIGDSGMLDANGKPVYRFNSDADYKLAAHPGQTATALLNGRIAIEGNFVKPVTTDDVTVRVYRNTNVIWEKTYLATQAVNEPVTLNLDVNAKDYLRFVVNADSNINWNMLAWNPKVYYVSSTDANVKVVDQGKYLVYLKPAIEYGMYTDRPDIGLNPQNSAAVPWVAPQTGKVVIIPKLAVSSTATGSVTFTIKSNGNRVYKKVLNVQDGFIQGSMQPAVTVDNTFAVNQGDVLWLEYHSSNITAPQIVGSQASVDYDDTPPDQMGDAAHTHNVAYYAVLTDTRFGPMYRQWGQFAYNGNNDRANDFIHENELYVDTSGADSYNFSNTDPAALQGAGYDASKAKFIIMLPDFDTGRWIGYDDETWITANTFSSSRLGMDSVVVNSGTSGGSAGSTGPLKITQSNDNSYQAGGGYSGGAFGASGGFSASTGTSRNIVEYMDLNGDRYPDVIVPNGIQYTNMQGGLDSTLTNNSDLGVPRLQNTDASGVNAGGSYSKSGDLPAAPKNIHEASMNEPSAGINGSYGESNDSEATGWADVNGDGLPDRIMKGGMVELNLGYRFGQPESWGFSQTNKGKGTSSSAGLGVNIGAYSIGGGVSISRSDNKSEETLTDVNGDGLPDRVMAGDPLRVAFNTGAGFTDAVEWNGASAITQGSSATESVSAYFTVCIPLPPFAPVVKLCINPGAGASNSMSRQEKQLQDINGDGVPDFLQSTNDGELQVSLNRNGRTNLLKEVKRPLGATIDIEYTRTGNTYAMPQSRWVMSKVSVNDGFAGDGVDTLITGYRYADGYYNRFERDFYGFASVVEEQKDASKVESVYRSVSTKYFNTNYYGKGLELSSTTADGGGNKYLQTINTYRLRDIESPTNDVALDDATAGSSATATQFSMLVKTEHYFFEGGSNSKYTYNTYGYDDFGNVTSYFDAGDSSADDDVDATISYSTDCKDSSYIIGKPKTIEVRGAGKLLRSRTGEISCGNGDMTSLSQSIGNGSAAVNLFGYYPNGNLQYVEGPANYKGQPYSLLYVYDKAVDTYVEQITDSFNYASTASYDYLFGKPLSTTDLNGNTISYRYDQFGRTEAVKGPYEQNGLNDTLSFVYKHDAVVPYAITHHLNLDASGRVNTPIDTVLFIDGVKRALQTKKSVAVNGVPMMSVSGHVVYDAMGRAIEQHYPSAEPLGSSGSFNYVSNEPDASYVTDTDYDVLDRTVHTRLPDGTNTSVKYDFGADRAGTLQFRTTVTDANGKQKESYRDVRQLITSVKEYNKGAAIWTSYKYDPLKQIVEVADAKGNLTKAEYDGLGRRVSLSNPDTGKTVTVFDNASNVIQKITANLAAAGKAINYEYDFNRLSGIKYPDTRTNDVHYAYGGATLHNNLNQIGRIVKVTDASGSEERAYGKLGETVKEIRTISSKTQGNSANSPEVYTTQYQYDTFGRLLKLTLPDSEIVTYAYDAGGNLASFAGDKQGEHTPYLKSLWYDKFEQRTRLVLGNDVVTEYAYRMDNRRLQNLSSQGSVAGHFQNINYTYDPVGNISDLANAVAIPPSSTFGGPTTQHFDYDDLYRLTSAKGTFQSSPDKTRAYKLDMGYDDIHNITGKTQLDTLASAGGKPVEQKATSYDWSEYVYGGDHPHAPTHIGSRSYNYDLNGNQTGWRDDKNGTRRIILWDEDNRITEVQDNGETSQYTYDDKGERVIKQSRQGETVYVSPYYVVRNRSIVSKHLFAGTSRLVTKLLMGTAPGNSYHGAGSNPQSTVQGSTTGSANPSGNSTQAGSHQGNAYGHDKTNSGQGNAYGQDNGNHGDSNGQVNNGQDKQNQNAASSNPGQGPSIALRAGLDHSNDKTQGHGNASTNPADTNQANAGQGNGNNDHAQSGKDGGLPGNSQAGLQNALNKGPGNQAGIYKHLAKDGYTIDTDGNIVIDDVPVGQAAPAQTSSGQSEFTYYYHPDHLGSTGYVTDANGKLYEHIEYFPFGETWVEEHSNTLRTPYLYTGKEFDQETGLYYFGARYYDPRTSVWQSADPILDSYLYGNHARGVYNSLNIQLYAYAAQNPMRFTDPDGKSFGDFIVGMGNAMSNNVTLGGIPRQQGNLDLRLGQAAGDIISIVIGIDEMGAGGGLMGAGAVATPTGVLTVPGAAAVAGGAALAGHGAGVTANASKNLGNGIGAMLSEALEGGSDGRGSNKPSIPTDKEAKNILEPQGYRPTNERVQNRKVFRNPKPENGKPQYVVRSNTQHTGDEAFKGAESVEDLKSSTTRSGTYDVNLNKVGD